MNKVRKKSKLVSRTNDEGITDSKNEIEANSEEKDVDITEASDNESDLEDSSENDDEITKHAEFVFRHRNGYRKASLKYTKEVSYEKWCENYSPYVDPMFYMIVEPFVKGFKEMAVNKLDIKDFYTFAYENSSGHISPYI